MLMDVYYLEFSSPEDHVNKFYEISLMDQTVTTRFGRIGTQGSQKIKTYATAEAAQQEVQKKRKEKERKGYKLISHSQPKADHLSLSNAPNLTEEKPSERMDSIVEPAILWRFNSGFSSFGLAVENEYCWLGNEKGRVLKIDNNGQILEQYQLPDAVKCIVTDDIWVYVGCDNGNVYDMTGKIPYIAYTIEKALDIFWLDINDGTLGVSDANGGVTKIDPEGEIVWNRLSPGKQGWMLCCDAQGFYHGHNKGLTMYEGEQGRQLWHQSTLGKVLFGCQQGDRLYVATSGKQVQCFNTQGELLKSYPCEASVYSCATNESGNYLFAGDSSGFIYCFNQQGQRLWKVSTGCGSALSMQFSSINGDRLYIATNQGILACFEVSSTTSKRGIPPRNLTAHETEFPVQTPQSTLKTAKSSESGILVECFRQGHRLRVRPLSDGYHSDWMVQFPYHLRQDGDRYLVQDLRESKQGGFYRVYGEIKRFNED